MQKIIFLLIVVGTFFSILPDTQAAISPVSVSILPPVQFPPEEFSITGVRASVFWGRHRDIYGIDVGLLGNMTNTSFVGLAVAGGFNLTKGKTTVLGLQLAGGANVNEKEATIIGIQAALGVNSNQATSSLTGIQVALVNLASFTTIYGVQLGLYNSAHTVNGFQIGVVNLTKNLHGLQIGLVNFNDAGPFVVSPVLNVGF